MKSSTITLICIFLITPLGFATKFYNGPGSNWVSNSLGGIFYEVFWCLVIYLLFPKLKIWKIAFGVFSVTSVLEFIQLINNPILAAIRSTFLGRTLLGTTFVVNDFCYYLIGSLAGWLLLIQIKKSQISNRHHSNTYQQRIF